MAMAYIDPGNGAYMVQALFTLLGAALFYIRHPIRTAKLVWNRLMRRGDADGDSPGSEPTRLGAREHSADFSTALPQDLADGPTVAVSPDHKA
jgi:hypothetical protein